MALPALTGVAGALIGATLGGLHSERLRDLYVREPRRVVISPLVSRECVGAEEEASSRPGTADAGPDLEPDAPPRTRAATGAAPGPVRRPGRPLPREPVAATARRPGGPLGAEDLDGARETPVAVLHPRRHQPA